MTKERPMLVTTTNDLPGHEIEEVLGSVFGLTVRSRHLGSTLGAAMKSVDHRVPLRHVGDGHVRDRDLRLRHGRARPGGSLSESPCPWWAMPAGSLAAAAEAVMILDVLPS
jgi:hypothetical protein